MRLRLTPLAAQDVAEARDRYAELSPALGARSKLRSTAPSPASSRIRPPIRRCTVGRAALASMAAADGWQTLRACSLLLSLADFPDMGRKVPEAGSADLREIIICRRHRERIEVLTVEHGSRDLARLLGRER